MSVILSPLQPPQHADELDALIEEARRRMRRRRFAYAAAVLFAAVVGAALSAKLALPAKNGSSAGTFAPPAPASARSTTSDIVTPFSFGYVNEGLLGRSRPGDRIMFARTRTQAVRWDRWLTHRRTTPPQSADFARQALVGVFLFGHRSVNRQDPSQAVQGVAVTSVYRSGDTLHLDLKVSPHPIQACGPGPDAPTECWPMYRTPSARYHAYTIVAISRALAARSRRIVVTAERYDPNPILVPVPAVP
jgi:hypothetical protein